ncbi:hypothetical protein [Actinomadura macra]|uniref:hypothetical protein n=1 Tax=Actinomadura macra TaxID=46164 RepID=UPI000832DA5C|nr:hypothetical protein [Actinomadura macra]
MLARLLDADLDERTWSRTVCVAQFIEFGNSRHSDTAWWPPLARRAVDLLAARPLHAARAVDIAIGAARLDGERDPERVAAGLAAVADLLRDRPVLAVQVRDRLDRLLGGFRGSWTEPAKVLPAARLLSGGDDVAAHLLAVGLVQMGGRAAGWTADWRDLLKMLRGSAHVEARQDAWDVVSEE